MFNSVCKMPIILAYLMIAYIGASFYYLCRTKNIGTPFKDTLSPIQRMIKDKSAQIRRKIFYEGLIITIVLILVIKPFKVCTN